MQTAQLESFGLKNKAPKRVLPLILHMKITTVTERKKAEPIKAK